MALFSDTQTNDVDPEKDYVSELVGEGKKFATIQELALSKVYSDAHIKRLEAEARELRDAEALARKDAQEKVAMQALIDKLEAVQNKRTPGDGNQPIERDDGNPTPPINNGEDPETLVERILAKKAEKDARSKNLEYVADVLKQNFGPGFPAVLAEKTKALGLGQEFVEDIAGRSPAALLALLNIAETPAAARNPVQGARVAPPAAKRNFAYYETIRKSDPTRYFSLTGEMLKALEEQGDDFYK